MKQFLPRDSGRHGWLGPSAAYRLRVPYPPRPLPQFVGTAVPRPDPAVQYRVEAFALEQYAGGRSQRAIAELTDRSFSAVRNILGKNGVRRRPSGAWALQSDHG